MIIHQRNQNTLPGYIYIIYNYIHTYYICIVDLFGKITPGEFTIPKPSLAARHPGHRPHQVEVAAGADAQGPSGS